MLLMLKRKKETENGAKILFRFYLLKKQKIFTVNSSIDVNI